MIDMVLPPVFRTAPREVQAIVVIQLASVAYSLAFPFFMIGSVDGSELGFLFLINLLGAALTLCLVVAFLARRRWAWMLLWFLSLASVAAPAVPRHGGERIAEIATALLFGLPGLVLLSRKQARSWILPRRRRRPVVVQQALRRGQVGDSSIGAFRPAARPLRPLMPLMPPARAAVPDPGRRSRRSAMGGVPQSEAERLPTTTAINLMLHQGLTIAELAASYQVSEDAVRDKARNG